MDTPVHIHSHGGRVHLLQTGEIKIDVAFLAVSSSDVFGNANGTRGRSPCGSLGYAKVDAGYARQVVLLTDEIVAFPNTPISISQDRVDCVVKIDEVGDVSQISQGAARTTHDPRELLIARSAADVVEFSGYFKQGFSLQTGSGGSSIAATRFLACKADTIEVRVYPGASGSFTLYEDEGDSYNYESGSYATIPMTFNGSSLTIGARSGTFTGMLQNRVFNIVYVTANHGVGEAKTTNPDCIINYTGVQVTACQVGILHEPAAAPQEQVGFSLKTASDHVVFDQSVAGRMKSVMVYDLGGRVVGSKAFRKNSFDLSREFGLGKGTYIVKVQVIVK